MSVQACSCWFLIRKKGKKIFQKLKRRAGGFPNQKGESVPALESVAHSELSNLAVGLTKEVSGEEEETECRDMAEAERELDGSRLGVLSEASVGVLSSAATFCCGGPDAASKLHPDETEKSSVKSETAGTHVDRDPSERSFISFIFVFLNAVQPFFVCLPSVPQRSSAASRGSLMFVRLRVQPSAGKKKGTGGLQLGSAKTLSRRDAWLALSQDRCSN